MKILSWFPRHVILFFIWLLTDWPSKFYETYIWPILGFLLLPYTTLAYMATMIVSNNDRHVSGGWFILITIAVFILITIAVLIDIVCYFKFEKQSKLDTGSASDRKI